MKKHIISILCAGAMILGLAGCRSDSVTSGGTGGAAAGNNTSLTDPDAPSVITSAAHIPEITESPDAPAYPQLDVIPHLTENDVLLEIAEGYYIYSDQEQLTLNVSYIGYKENAEYCFGCMYTLKSWDNASSDWKTVEFAPDSAFNALGYIISNDYPKNSISVSLNDDFYAEPLNAGYYRVELEIEGIVFGTTFELMDTASDAEYVIDSPEGDITLQINEIQPDRFVCELPWPYHAAYEVMCDTSEYSEFCTGDIIEVTYAPKYEINPSLYRLIPTSISMSDFELQEGADYKPVIYLYPEKETEASVKLGYNGTLTITEPEYGDGWSVTAKPDGTLTAEDGKDYPYLFWEGERNFGYDIIEGFCVSGDDTAAFLSEKLSYLGLSDSEKAEFLEFWLPHMEKNAYNIITFRGEDYTDNAVLDIAPAPDTVIRVFMTYAPSDGYIEIAPQTLSEAPERNGFTVVEWGGAVISLD